MKAILSSSQVSVLEQALGAASLRQKVISNNIANVNTPGYKRSEVIFEDLLQDAVNEDKLQLTQTNEGHFSLLPKGSVSPMVNTVSNNSLRTDGNNVDIDVEMANLAKNSIYYNAVAQQLGKYFTNLKAVINSK